MSQKRNSGVGGASASMTVAEYSRQFFDRVLRKSYGPTEGENVTVAGQKFCTLVKKLQEAASKDDVKVTLRVLRDEIGRVYFAGGEQKKQEKIEVLFQLYDALEADCQEALKVPGRGSQHASSLLAELRDRFTRLAVGETWETFPELRLLALKRIQKYAVRENEQLRLRGRLGIDGFGPSSGSRGAVGKRFQAMAIGPSPSDTWQDVLNNLGKAASAKLLPLLKALLLESYQRESEDPAAALPAAPPPETAPEDSSVSSSPTQEGRQLKSTNSITVADSGHKLSEININLDDLLGLNDPVPAAPASGPPQDPFQLLAENGVPNGVGTPTGLAPVRSAVLSSTPLPSPFSQAALSPPPAQFAAPSASPFAAATTAPSHGSLGTNGAIPPAMPAANPFGDVATFGPPVPGVPQFSQPPTAGANLAGPFGIPGAFPPAPAPAGFGFGAQAEGSGSVPLPGPSPVMSNPGAGGGFGGSTFSGGFGDLVNLRFAQPGQAASGPLAAPAAVPRVTVTSPAGQAPAGFGESTFGPSSFGSSDRAPSSGTLSKPGTAATTPASANPFFAAVPPVSQPASQAAPQPFAW